MSFANRVSQTLHEEHRATVALMERLEQMIGRHRSGQPPAIADHTVARLLSDLVTGVTGEITRHFDFEENHLFAFLGEIGDEAIAAHLTEEHDVMRPVGVRVAALARQALVQGFDPAGWDEFRRLGMQLCERMLAHVQKEELALLPLLEENMDAETELRLYQDYAEHA